MTQLQQRSMKHFKWLIGVILSLSDGSTIAFADAVLELVPVIGGSYVSDQVVPVEVWLHNSDAIDIDLRHVELDFRGLRQELFAGGAFQNAGGLPAAYVARLDGDSWVPVDGLEVSGPVNGLTQVVTPSSIDLVVGGQIANVIRPYLVKWNGQETFDHGLDWTLGSVMNLVSLKDGPNLRHFVTGEGIQFDGHMGEASEWVGGAWDPLHFVIGGVADVALYGNGISPEIYVCGPFGYHYSGPQVERIFCIAKYTANGWAHVGGGFRTGIGEIRANALAVFDEGGGPRLFAAGNFKRSWNGQFANVITHKISRWNGTAWSSVGGGINPDLPGSVYDMVVLDDGTGPALYVAGTFELAGGVTVSNIARWDGIEWSDVGGGVTGGTNPSIRKLLVVKNECGGSALIAGGSFTEAGGIAVSNVALWDGHAWSPVGDGFDNTVHALLAAHVEGEVSAVPPAEFEFDFGTISNPAYFVVPNLPNPSITYVLQSPVSQSILRLPASGSLRIGTLSVLIPEGTDDYAIDVASPLASHGGSEVRYGFGSPGDPLVTLSSFSGTLTGLAIEFERGFKPVDSPCGNSTEAECDHADTCDGAGSCQANWEPGGTPCTDGNLCTLGDSCQSGICVAGEDPLLCLPDSSQCTYDYCDPFDGCVHPNMSNGTCCDDGNASTHCDKCANGLCKGVKTANCTPCNNPEE